MVQNEWEPGFEECRSGEGEMERGFELDGWEIEWRGGGGDR